MTSNAEIIISPLIDENLGESIIDTCQSTVADLEIDQSLRSTIDEIMIASDSEGYAVANYGEVASAVAKTANVSLDLLPESPWLMHDSLDKIGVIAAPDSLLERRRLPLNDKLVLYRSDLSAPPTRLRSYKKALLAVKYITLAFQPLNDNELVVAGQIIDKWIKDVRHRRHLRGLLRWYNNRRRMLDKRTKLMHYEIMSKEDCHVLTQQILTLAAMRGHSLDGKTMIRLDKVLQLLGHKPNTIHSLLHRSHFSFSSIFSTAKKQTSQIDNNLLSDIERQTKEVRNTLAEVFNNAEVEEEKDNESAQNNAKDITMEVINCISQKAEWPISELQDRLRHLDIMLMIEKINDLSIRENGDTAIDVEEDIAYVTQEYLENLKIQV